MQRRTREFLQVWARVMDQLVVGPLQFFLAHALLLIASVMRGVGEQILLQNRPRKQENNSERWN